MTAGDSARTIRATGRLVVGPSNLDAAFPYGGTEVGKTRLVYVMSLGEQYRVEAELLGQASDVLEADKRFVFSCMLRGWDDDAVDLLMSDGDSVGSVSDHAVWSAPGSRTPGQSALGRAVVLLFVPDDTVNVPALLVYSGVPQVQPAVELSFQRQTELAIPLAAECFEDGNGNILSIGRLDDLSLT